MDRTSKKTIEGVLRTSVWIDEKDAARPFCARFEVLLGAPHPSDLAERIRAHNGIRRRRFSFGKAEEASLALA